MKATKTGRPAAHIPDWRDEKAYPSATTTSANRWSYEFLTRNPDFVKACEGISKLKGPRNDPSSPFRRRWREIADKFWIAWPLLPEWGFDSPVSFKRAPETLRSVRLRDSPGYWFLAEAHEWEVAMAFDLRQSVTRQLTSARRLLDRHQRDKRIELVKGTQRKRDRNYQAMLRILDARDTSETWTSIAKAIFPSKDTDSATALAKKLGKQAERLRDGGYRYIVF